MAETTIIKKIKASYPYQSKKKKLISDFILENMSRCCFLSLNKLSKEVGITEVTMLNYCRDLGYASFSEFREAIRSYVVFWKHPNERMWNIGGSGADKSFITNITEAEKEMILSLPHQDEKINEAIALILSRKKIFVAAHGISNVSADYCQRRLTVIGKDTTFLPINDHHLMAMQLSQFDPEECLLVAFAITPHGESTTRAVKLCKEEGIDIISVTDNPESEIAVASSVSIIGNASLRGVTNSLLSTIALIDIIAIAAAAESHKRSPETEERYRRMLEFSEDNATSN